MVAKVESVDWGPYGACAGLMLAGMLLRHLASGETPEQEAAHGERIDVLAQSLDELVTRVGALARIDDEQELAGLHRRIDAEVVEHFNRFVEARESMIPRFGMQRYADVMSPFALGERLVNRAWSASVDGYVDEVRSCVAQAASALSQSRDLLAEARAG